MAINVLIELRHSRVLKIEACLKYIQSHKMLF